MYGDTYRISFKEKGKDHLEHDKDYKLSIFLSFFLIRLGFKG